MLGLSVRQVWRLKAGYRKDGVAGFMHGNRGRPSPGRLSEVVRSRVVELLAGPYAGCNDHHLADSWLSGKVSFSAARAWNASAARRG